MILRRAAVRSDRPSLPGGGTVKFVNDDGHDYATAVEAREEAGTPNVVGDIRAALVFVLKDHVGQAWIDDAHRRWMQKAARLQDVAGVQMLGRDDVTRLPILAFRLRDGAGDFVHQQLATRMLSDLFGVQARGGCACAGPYVLRLLGIGAKESAALRAAILSGREIEKPGFVRLNLCWAAPEAEIDAILTAITELAANAPQYLARYQADPATAIFSPLAA
jgi:selenocysteine lyase/cysteine desulfurase